VFRLLPIDRPATEQQLPCCLDIKQTSVAHFTQTITYRLVVSDER